MITTAKENILISSTLLIPEGNLFFALQSGSTGEGEDFPAHHVSMIIFVLFPVAAANCTHWF